MATIEDYQWLISDDALPFLNLPETPSLPLSKKLRKHLSAERVRLIVEQRELRGRATSKFSKADRLYYTKKGLEQATDAAIAQFKSKRFGDFFTFADLCCGIGGDLFELPAGQTKIGVDQDPITSLLCQRNCLELGNDTLVETKDAESFPIQSVEAWHIDPDRRSDGNRTVRTDRFQPQLSAVLKLLAQNPNGTVKLAPATPTDADWLQDAELHWLGHGRSCHQLVAFFGETAKHPNARVVTLLKHGIPHTLVVNRAEPTSPDYVDQTPATSQLAKVEQFIFEPHATVLAAGLPHALAEREGFKPLIPGGGYLTAANLKAGELYQTFEVLQVDAYRESTVSRALKSLNAGKVEVKKRGVELNPNHLERKWNGSGTCRLTVIIFRQGNSMLAAITRRIDASVATDSPQITS